MHTALLGFLVYWTATRLSKNGQDPAHNKLTLHPLSAVMLLQLGCAHNGTRGTSHRYTLRQAMYINVWHSTEIAVIISALDLSLGFVDCGRSQAICFAVLTQA